MTLETISRTLITLKVDQKEVLFLMLAQDGSINRKGDGTPDCNDNDLYIGNNNEGLFDQLKSFLTEDMGNFLQKTYDVPDKKGRLCDLTILFGGEGVETGTQFLYGEFSQGPPKPFVDYCVNAMNLTEGWFQSQKKMSSTAERKIEPKPEKKSWWKFW